MDDDAKEIGAILGELGEKIQKFITGIMDILYSPEAGKKIGSAVGNFYKELKDAGLPEDEALKMTRDYLTAISNISQSMLNKEKIILSQNNG
ncbi:MAG: hypothetical protein WBI55_03590 [Eubacteriales bacterium]|jgi:hypothetical protein|nr:hypothetical protein [Clostridiales bacterium]